MNENQETGSESRENQYNALNAHWAGRAAADAHEIASLTAENVRLQGEVEKYKRLLAVATKQVAEHEEKGDDRGVETANALAGDDGPAEGYPQG